MAGLTPAHLLIILVIALIVIGPGKLPEVGAAIGKSFREFQKAAGSVTDPLNLQGQQEPTQPAVPYQQMPVQQMQVPPIGQQPPAQSYYAAQPGYTPVQYGGQPAQYPAYPPQAPAPYAPYPPQAFAAQQYSVPMAQADATVPPAPPTPAAPTGDVAVPDAAPPAPQAPAAE